MPNIYRKNKYSEQWWRHATVSEGGFVFKRSLLAIVLVGDGHILMV